MVDRLIQYADLSGPVRYRDCDDLRAAIDGILRGWRPRELPSGSVRPTMRFSRTTEGAYRRISPRHATPSSVRAKIRKGLVAAVCGFHFEVIDWYCEEHPDHLFVHGAAVALAGRLVLFPAVSHAGKSTLSVYLAMAGARVWGDDVVPLGTRTGRGVALGILPRLRRARPGAETSAFQDYVRDRRTLANDNRIYVDPGAELLPPLGEEAPVGAVVLLQREEGGRARIEDLDPSDALEEIILQNFAREVPTPRVLETLHGIVTEAACHRLVFASSSEACRLLLRELG